MKNDNKQKKVIIIGGGFCGLVCAVVCSHYFDDVTVIERGTPSQGVPQETHIHSLQARGLQIIEELLPDISRDLKNTGAVTVRWTQDIQVWLSRGYVPQVDAEVTSIGVSRHHLEAVIRERVHQIANVCFKYRHEVQGLTCENGKITQMHIVDRISRAATIHAADIIVDCSGRQSKTAHWFKQIGYDVPDDISISSHLGYASRWYKIPQAVKLDMLGIAIQPKPHEKFYRGAAVGVVENQKAVITLVGVNKDYPPTDKEGFADFASSLDQPIVQQLIQKLEPVSPIYGYRAANRLRPYHKMRSYPANYFVLGDAYCAFNPIYGQGMMVAAMSAKRLKEYLSGYNDIDLSAKTFQKQLFWTILISWLLATGEDMRYPSVTGKKPNLIDRLAHRFLDFLFIASNRDQFVGVTLLQVVQRIKSPLYLANPILLIRAFFAVLFRKPQTSA